jgi:hypothetical protein
MIVNVKNLFVMLIQLDNIAHALDRKALRLLRHAMSPLGCWQRRTTV